MSHEHDLTGGCKEREMPAQEEIIDLSELFKVLGDPTRIRILCALSEGELGVSDIASLLGYTQSAISHQLRVLKQARLVKYRRDGKAVLYSVSDDHVHTMMAMGLEHVNE